MKNKLLLIHFLFFIPFCLFALPKDLQFRHYNLEDGLSSNCVRALLQDKFGFIWAGTDGGLIRYDGTEFKSYKYSNKLPRGLNQNFILSLYEANDALWIGTDEGLFCYDYSNDSFSPFLINGKIAIDKPVICVAQDQDSTIWIATDGYGLYKYNIENDSIQHYEITSCLGFVYTVIVDNENQVWIVSKQGNTHVFKLNRITDRFEPFKLIYNTPEE